MTKSVFIRENPCPMKVFILPALLLSLFLPGNLFAAGWKGISPQRVYDLIKEGSGLWLIDVRGAQSFERGHIVGAVNIPLASLGSQHLPPQTILVLVDNSLGSLQAREAAEVLVGRGQQRAFVLEGGVGRWRQEGLPMVPADDWELARLLPGELERALRSGVALEILDLRSAEERQRTPLAGSREMAGGELAGQLETLRNQLAKPKKKEMGERLKEEKPVVVVFPSSADARTLYQQHLWRLPVPVRVMEGGYLAGTAMRGRMTVSNAEGCASCPGN